MCRSKNAGQHEHGGLPRDATIDKVYRKHGQPPISFGEASLSSALSVQC
jgi:hypothetical protein